MINIGISFAFLYTILERLIGSWAPLALDREEENLLAASFQRFDEFAHEQLLEHRSLVNVEKRAQLEAFGEMLRLVGSCFLAKFGQG